MGKKCQRCGTRILSHSCHLNCCICKEDVHLSCIPFVSKTDSIYVHRFDNYWFCFDCTSSILPFNWIADNDEFLDIIIELNGTENSISISQLNEKIFVPFEINDETRVSPLYDTDPDLHYFNTLTSKLASCDYHIEDTFNRKLNDLSFDENCFSLLSINIRSIPKNISCLQSYMSLLDNNFSVIGVTETWLHDANHDKYNLDGYNQINNYRTSRIGGGVSLYIMQCFEYIERKDLFRMESYIECLFVEVQTLDKSEKHKLIGVVYRPPDTRVELFNDAISEVLSILKTENKKCYILGDFNLNLLNSDKHPPTDDFINIMFSYSFVPVINKPTRISNKSATLIDNIFVNDIDAAHFFHGILFTDISDHFPLFYIDSSSKLNKNQRKLSYRDYSHTNINSFTDKLTRQDWSNVTNSNNPSEAYTHFHNIFINTYNSCFPYKQAKNNYKNKKVWLTQALKNSIKNKNKLFILTRRHPSELNFSNYKKYRNRLNQLLRTAERNHYEQLFSDNRLDMRKKWSIIKDIINKKKTNNLTDTILSNGMKIKDKNKIANTFNNYFVNIGTDLAKSISPTATTPSQYLPEPNPNSMYLYPVVDEEVEKIIKELKISSPGWDNISNKVVKVAFKSFITPLTHVLNLSIMNGFFPCEMKIAKVLPFKKNGDTLVVSNYRPISVLPLFSKILEKLIYNRILKFIIKYNILYPHQFGFREGHSTGMALITMVDKIVTALDDGKIAIGLFLDFSKAFDTVDHSILFSKLERYGIRGLALTMMKNYLSDRYQFVEYNGVQSEKLLIKCGVPQGSILGPLLFLLYINDLPNVSKVLSTTIFADDTNMFITGSDAYSMINTINTEMKSVVNWLNCNKLSLNVSKSHYMLFNNKKVMPNCSIFINGQQVERVCETKFLGVLIDEKLSWKSHISFLKKKISRNIGILRKAKKVLNESTLLNLYYSFIYPYFLYGIEVWGSAYKTNINTLFKLQKRIVRLISNAKYLASTAPLFEKHKLLNIFQLHIYKNQIYMFKFVNNKLPAIFNYMFVRNSTVHSINTRQKDKFHMPKCKTDLSLHSFRYTSVKYFNMFETKVDYTKNSFKKILKLHLLQNSLLV